MQLWYKSIVWFKRYLADKLTSNGICVKNNMSPVTFRVASKLFDVILSSILLIKLAPKVLSFLVTLLCACQLIPSVFLSDCPLFQLECFFLPYPQWTGHVHLKRKMWQTLDLRSYLFTEQEFCSGSYKHRSNSNKLNI